jgi:hypothetical protein
MRPRGIGKRNYTSASRQDFLRLARLVQQGKASMIPKRMYTVEEAIRQAGIPLEGVHEPTTAV